MRLNRIRKKSSTAVMQRLASLLTKALSVPTTTSEDVRERAKGPTTTLWTGQHPASVKFKSWLQGYGVVAPPAVPQFKDGGDGRAYFVGRHVVKFTRDRAGANVANMCTKVPGAPAPVIAVWRVPGEPVWAILQLLVQPERVAKDVATAADYLTVWMDDNPDIESFPPDRQGQEAEAAKVVEHFGLDPSLIPSLVMVMNAHSKLYHTTGFSHTDGGPTNISMKDDELVYHDLGPNMTGSYKPREVLDKIHANRQKLNLPVVDEV